MSFFLNVILSWDKLGQSFFASLQAAFIAGVLAIFFMSLVMALFNFFKLAEADMIRAVGSLLTRKVSNAFFPGLVIQIIMSVFFTLIYGFLFNLLPEKYLIHIPAIGAGFGLFHGGVVSWAIASIVSDYHPVKRFQEAKLEEALAHTVGHIVFGLVIGFAFMWTLPGQEKDLFYLIQENSKYFIVLAVLLSIFSLMTYAVKSDEDK